MLSERRFKLDADLVSMSYRNHNSWFQAWSTEQEMDIYIDAAWQLYDATRTRRLEFTVLGGTEIRTAKMYLRSFGLTGKSGLQSRKAKVMRSEEDGARLQRALNPHPDSTNPDTEFLPTAGYGSILSEKKWSPMLNDALILGAVSSKTDLCLALTPREMRHWKRLTHTKNDQNEVVSKITKMMVMQTRYGQQKKTPKELWKEFLNSEQQMFFNDRDGIPRVFARELLGLAFFGYEPVFSWHQLGFRPAKDSQHVRQISDHYDRLPPSIPNYVRGLSRLGFHNVSKTTLLKAISDFLFQDDSAIA